MKRSIVIIAHNIRSLWNIGSFFRSADAFGIDHIYLTGYTAAPPRKEISKTALGAEAWIPWSKTNDPMIVIGKLKKDGYRIVALEKTKGSVPIQEYANSDRVCLILGHEILGVPDDLLKESDAIVHIEMQGKKESLNVSVAAGIAMYALSLHKP